MCFYHVPVSHFSNLSCDLPCTYVLFLQFVMCFTIFLYLIPPICHVFYHVPVSHSSNLSCVLPCSYISLLQIIVRFTMFLYLIPPIYRLFYHVPVSHYPNLSCVLPCSYISFLQYIFPSLTHFTCLTMSPHLSLLLFRCVLCDGNHRSSSWLPHGGRVSEAVHRYRQCRHYQVSKTVLV